MKETKHILFWDGITVEITHTEDWHGVEFDHLEIRTMPREQPLPITKTGYKSNFLKKERITEEGDAVTYVKNWLDYEVKSPEWAAYVAESRQLTLL